MPAAMMVQAPTQPSASVARAWALRVYVWAGPGVGDAEEGLFAQLRRQLPGRCVELLRPGWDSPDPEKGLVDLLVVPIRGGGAAFEKQLQRAQSERSPLAERLDRWMSSVALRVVEREASFRAFMLSEDSVEILAAEEPERLSDAVEGLVTAIEQGQPLRQALEVANALVRSRGGLGAALRPTEDRGLERALVCEAWRPLGWPVPSVEAGRLLQEAWGKARARSSGFVGVEHLAELLPEHAPGLPKRVRDALTLERPTLRRYAELELRPGPEPNWDGTKRLQALGPQLAAGFGLGDLARALMSPQSPVTRALVEASVDAGPARPAQRVEVYGGPEDGRVLNLEPGQHLGRAGPQALYRDTTRTDVRLSARHAEWLGPGRLLLEQAAEILRPGGPELVGPGVTALHVGEVLALTRATRLRGVG